MHSCSHRFATCPSERGWRHFNPRLTLRADARLPPLRTSALERKHLDLIEVDQAAEDRMRFRLRKWVFIPLALWCLTGLPALVVGIRMVGTDYSIGEWLQIFVPHDFGLVALITWLGSLIVVFFPLLILPFAIEKKPSPNASRHSP